ncbi:MAG: hypothetical protein ACREUO_09845 [Burkholderiales bacterium]
MRSGAYGEVPLGVECALPARLAIQQREGRPPRKLHWIALLLALVRARRIRA